MNHVTKLGLMQHADSCRCVLCVTMAVQDNEETDGANLNDDQAYCENEPDEWEE